MCGEIADEFRCKDCDLPVCEDCCVQPTYMNQVDYTQCQECGDYAQEEYFLEVSREQEYEAKLEAKRQKRRDDAKTRYWKPENVEKRRLKKIERNKLRVERNQKAFASAMKIVGDMMGNN